jgi:hypothetical protein
MKKYIFVLSALTLVLASCFNPTKKAVSADFAEYGTFKVDATKAVPVEKMIADFTLNGSKRSTYTISANIEEVCAKAGCWINIKNAAGKDLMVRFKDHFTIPTDTKVGTQAFLHGDLFTDTVSVEWLQHFAEDAGKPQEEIDKITEPKITMGFEADGIKFIAKK